ncbi:MAG: sulfatase-like hydrolase/transferase [Verrucomicrobiota bacterium]
MKLNTGKNLVAGGLLGLVVGVFGGEKPNILFIMSDDHTSQAVGCYGGRLQSLNPTPTLDALAAEGMVMENAFCQNAICTPSRASIMTGQSSAKNGVPTLSETLPVEKHYLPQEMKKAGYQTAMLGKWHLKARPESFDYYKVLEGQGDYFDPVFYEKGVEGVDLKKKNMYSGFFTGKYKNYKGVVPMEGHSTDVITDIALDWFENRRDPEKPFFVKLHFKAPHDYFRYAPRYESYLADVEIPEPHNLHDRMNNGSIATRGVDDELLEYLASSIGDRHYIRNFVIDASPWRDKLDRSQSEEALRSQAYQEYMKHYLRCVKGVDDNLKRVFDYLKKEGLYDNTVIMYTGDQGFYLGEHDFIDKRWAYEEGMRMPFIVRYPKSVKVGRSQAIVENIDYPATMLDFAGVETPEKMDGRSFRAVLETGEEPEGWKQSAYYHYWMHLAHHWNPAHIAVRTKKYKLIFFYGTGWQGESEPTTPPGWELYDLEADPSEDNNLYGDPKYDLVVAELKEELKKRRAELGEDDAKFAFNAVIDDFWDYDEEDQKRARQISAQYRAACEKEKAERAAKKAGQKKSK